MDGCNTPLADDPQLELLPKAEDEQPRLPPEEFVIDEMNLVEMPFCLLKNTNQVGKVPISRVPLSADGKEYLESSSQTYGLPTALARRTVLGLVWLTMEQNGFKEQKVTFHIRDLIKDYMFPGRYPANDVGSKTIRAVENELHRVAATRIYSSRWYDKKLGQHTRMDAAIIDYVQVIDEGGKNRPMVIEVGWGRKFFESIQSRYTKGLDMHVWMQIANPIDEALYRWLDRQLSAKSSQRVESCQSFARFKLLMQGDVVARGGRTASSYIAAKLEESLQRLSGIGFPVRMTVDKTKTDFGLLFEKVAVPAKAEAVARNEVVEYDETGDLVMEFKRTCQGYPATDKPKRLREKDRELAAEWLNAYGREQATWMVRRCKDLHQKGPQAGVPLFSFNGLSFYKSQAESDYLCWQKEHDGQLRLRLQEHKKERWDAYRNAMARAADGLLGKDTVAKLAAEARESVTGQYVNTCFRPPENVLEKFVDSALETLKLARVSIMPEAEFMACETNDILRKALVRRHGRDPLAR